MANFEFDITSHRDEIMDALETQLAKAMEECGMTAETFAKAVAPVDTGRLRNSISHGSDSSEMVVGTNVEYASYVELGTSRTREQPYLTPAVQDHINEYKAIIENNLKG